MSHCIIIAGMYRGEEKDRFLKKQPGDLLLCADSGYAAAVRYGMEPDMTLGDFDSMDEKETGSSLRIRFPVKKDDTDLRLCMKEGWKRGYREFRIGGGLGGRFDHTLANLAVLEDLARRGLSALLDSGRARARFLIHGRVEIPREDRFRYLSLLPAGTRSTGVSLSGVKYPLTNATLYRRRAGFSVSNEITAPSAALSLRSGPLWILETGD